jgi:hypothetical protein
MRTKKPNAAKDTSEWVTGGEPMTGPQESYLGTLSREACTPALHDLTKAEASEKNGRVAKKIG